MPIARTAEHLSGVLSPVVTTFTPAGNLALDAFEQNLRAHLAAGLSGVVVAGSTGEAALLDEPERHALLDRARAVVSQDRWLIAGIGAESTRLCIRRAQEAAERGADAALVVAPHYYASSMTGPALLAHYQRVADASPIPLLLYNIPKYTHFALGASLVADLARHGNVIGIKDSSGDLSLLAGYLAAQSPTFAVLTGNGSSLQSALERGARGGVLAVALFAAPLALEVYREQQRGRAGAAARAQRRLAALAAAIVGELGVPGVKAALDLVGLRGGDPRPPLLPLDGAGRERVRQLLATENQPPAA